MPAKRAKKQHSKIQKIDDPFIPFENLEKDLNNLKILLDENDSMGVKNFLRNLIQSYKPHSKIVDHIYVEKMALKDNFHNIVS